MSQFGRNDPCPCGSGKKYKQCCLSKNQVKPKGLFGRKIVAYPSTKSSDSEDSKNEPQQTIKPVDYSKLVDKNLSEALKRFTDKPPMPENLDD